MFGTVLELGCKFSMVFGGFWSSAELEQAQQLPSPGKEFIVPKFENAPILDFFMPNVAPFSSTPQTPLPALSSQTVQTPLPQTPLLSTPLKSALKQGRCSTLKKKVHGLDIGEVREFTVSVC